jgi:hypothetical protein
VRSALSAAAQDVHVIVDESRYDTRAGRIDDPDVADARRRLDLRRHGHDPTGADQNVLRAKHFRREDLPAANENELRP